MSTLKFSELGRLPALLWRKWQVWRAMRIYERVVRIKCRIVELEIKQGALFDKANRLIGRNVKPPMPLFDHLDDREGR